jgi:hypothetical protein
MICPHCYGSLLRKERSDRRCSKCRRDFALEPKQSPLGLHDVRVQKLAEKLSGGRDLWYSLPQLWYAAARGKLPDPGKRFGGIRGGVGFAIIVVSIIIVLTGAINRLLATVLAILVFTLTQLALRAVRPRFVRTARIAIPVTYDKFRRELTQRWPAVYNGQLPPGAIDERVPRPPGAPRPRYAVLCPDRAVLACLAANRGSHSTVLALAERTEELPPGVPVIVLHDASVSGVHFASWARSTLEQRVPLVVAGLTPRAVLANASSLRLREAAPARAALAGLPRESLSEAEVDWLAGGSWSPLAALPPAKLLAMVEHSVERIENAADPDRRHARAIGFLTWPT